MRQKTLLPALLAAIASGLFPAAALEPPAEDAQAAPGITAAAPGTPETLEEAADAAAAGSLPLRSAHELTEAARANLDAARGRRLPTVTLSANHLRLDRELGMNVSLFGFSASVPITDDKTTGFAASAALPLFTGGRITKTIEAGEAGAKSAELTEAASRSDIRLKAAELFISVKEARALLSAARIHEAALEAHLARAKARFRKGMAVKNEVYAAEAALETARDSTITADTAVKTAESAYNRLLGRPLDSPVSLAPLPEPVVTDTLAELTDKAVRSSSRLGSISEKARAARATSVAEKAGLLPQASLVGGWVRQNSQYLNQGHRSGWVAGVVLSWNVFDGGIRSSLARSSERTAAALTAARDEEESVLRLAVRTAWLKWEETESRKRAADASLRSAEENLRVSERRFETGLALHTEVLDAESLREAAQARLVRAEGERQRAYYRLRRLANTI